MGIFDPFVLTDIHELTPEQFDRLRAALEVPEPVLRSFLELLTLRQVQSERLDRTLHEMAEQYGNAKRPVRVLANSKELPRWLQDKPNYAIVQRNNLWMLFNALVAGSANVTLIALWNGQTGDGPGGTADMIEKAKERGARTIVLDTHQIFANG